METLSPELTPAKLEGLELWDRTTHAPANQAVKVAFVSVRVGGNIGMNTAAYSMWGKPRACQVMFDPERRRLGLVPCEREEVNSYDLDWSSVQIPCKKLFDFYGVETTQSRRYHDPKVIDGVLVVDL